MGCDGGTIPKRDELVRKKKKAEQDNSLTLLRLYQNYPVLWNPKDENYLNFFKKDDAWDEIASRMKLSKDECRRRIVSLKGSYRREKARMKNDVMNETGNAYQSKWFAFNAMAFLDEERESEKAEFEKMELEKTEPCDTFVKDKVAQRSFLWRHCNISQTPLHDPVVACGLGRLYNKDALIMALLDKTLLPETAGHIKSLKDVKELKLTNNPSYEASIDKGDKYVDHQSSPYICPVIGHEMNGNFKFCFSWGCGCVVSERAMKQLKSNLCHKCQSPVTAEDIVILNPEGEELELMKTRMEARLAKIKAEKKSKKIKKEIKEEVDTDSVVGSENGCSSSSEIIPKVEKTDITVPVKIEKTVPIKVEKNGFKRPAEGNLSMKNEDFKKTKSEYSVAKDPNASSVYKSLFTSSSKAQNQMKAHWITYNPFYN